MLLPSFIIPDAGGGPVGYKLTNSIRFNGSSSRMMSPVATSPSNNPIKWTFNGWVRRGKLSILQNIFGSGATASGSSAFVTLAFQADDTIQFRMRNSSGTDIAVLATVEKFRDISAFYNINFVYDSAQDDTHAADRAILHVNGVRYTLVASNPIERNLAPPAPFDTSKAIGARNTAAAWAAYFDGVISAAHFADGFAYLPDGVFGEFDTNGRFVPINTKDLNVGKQGMRLLFNSTIDTASLGNDSAAITNEPTGPNHSLPNTWTLSGLTHTATPNANECSLTSSPTNNIAVGNQLEIARTSTAGAWSFSQLKLTLNSTALWGAADIALDSVQKVYAEVTCTSGIGSTTATQVGIGILQQVDGVWSLWCGYTSDGQKVVDGVATPGFGAAYTNADIIGVGYDPTTKLATFWKNTALVGTIDMSAVSPPADSLRYLGATARGGAAGARVLDFNFGQRLQAMATPSQYVSQTPSTVTTVDVAGSYTGNATGNGPFIFCNGTPKNLLIGGAAPPAGTVDLLANGFKLRTATGNNAAGSHTWSADVDSRAFINQNAQVN